MGNRETKNIKLKRMSELGKSRFISPYIFDGRKNNKTLGLQRIALHFAWLDIYSRKNRKNKKE